MQKSKIITIIIMSFILIYIFLAQGYLYKLEDIYTYIINPAFWILTAIVLKNFLIPTYHTRKFKKEIVQYVLITVLIYVIVYLISGLFVTFGQNPYSTTLYGMLLNFLTTGTVIVAREYIRYRLIHNVYQKDQKVMAIAIIILLTLVEFNIIEFFSSNLRGYLIFKQVFYKMIPLLLKNILFTYVAYKVDYTANVVYDLLIYIFLWGSPILPKEPWVMEAIIDSIFPIILLLYIKYFLNKKSRFKLERKISESANPVGLVPLSILLILLIWFALGVLPIKPIAVATRKYGTNFISWRCGGYKKM